MDLLQSKVLITGGTDGIGKALAKKFNEAGSRVIVTGRNVEKLRRTGDELQNIETFKNDISKPEEREKLAEYIREHMPDINILINNAGIQRRVELSEDHASWEERQNEIDILLSAPIHLNHLLVPVLIAHGQPSVIINVTSGGAYIPQVFAPVYSACKSALRSYTMTLRHSLVDTKCRVVELIPPAVQTKLASGNTAHGVLLEEFVNGIFSELTSDQITEVGYGQTKNIEYHIFGKPLKEVFETFAKRFSVSIYSKK